MCREKVDGIGFQGANQGSQGANKGVSSGIAARDVGSPIDDSGRSCQAPKARVCHAHTPNTHDSIRTI